MIHKDSPQKQICKATALAALAEVGNIGAACKQAHITPQTFTRWRNQGYITIDEYLDAKVHYRHLKAEQVRTAKTLKSALQSAAPVSAGDMRPNSVSDGGIISSYDPFWEDGYDDDDYDEW